MYSGISCLLAGVFAKSIAIVVAYVLCFGISNRIIRNVLKRFKIAVDDENNDQLPRAGRLIGILERILVLTFVLVDALSAVGWLIAAKSILRFKDTDTLKAEYVLAGTLLSFFIPIMLGVIIKTVFF